MTWRTVAVLTAVAASVLLVAWCGVGLYWLTEQIRST